MLKRRVKKTEGRNSIITIHELGRRMSSARTSAVWRLRRKGGAVGTRTVGEGPGAAPQRVDVQAVGHEVEHVARGAVAARQGHSVVGPAAAAGGAAPPGGAGRGRSPDKAPRERSLHWRDGCCRDPLPLACAPLSRQARGGGDKCVGRAVKGTAPRSAPVRVSRHACRDRLHGQGGAPVNAGACRNALQRYLPPVVFLHGLFRARVRGRPLLLLPSTRLLAQASFEHPSCARTFRPLAPCSSGTSLSPLGFCSCIPRVCERTCWGLAPVPRAHPYVDGSIVASLVTASRL
mmetsp:Transcript_49050/g.104302  ORF Transcript_49050/g.104302 Transcript_49050/m.104302 type:complete len:290 (+) Transcript_49050:171-1040(+)